MRNEYSNMRNNAVNEDSRKYFLQVTNESMSNLLEKIFVRVPSYVRRQLKQKKKQRKRTLVKEKREPGQTLPLNCVSRLPARWWRAVGRACVVHIPSVLRGAGDVSLILHKSEAKLQRIYIYILTESSATREGAHNYIYPTHRNHRLSFTHTRALSRIV